MKKKRYPAICAGIGIAAAAVAIYLLTRPKVLGNINHSFSSSEPMSDTSAITFFAEEKDWIRLYLVSDVQQGDLDIAIYDSAGNLAKELDKAKELVTYLNVDYADTYTLTAKYKDLAGSFKVVVSIVN